jgi:hypothetical protein
MIETSFLSWLHCCCVYLDTETNNFGARGEIFTAISFVGIGIRLTID